MLLRWLRCKCCGVLRRFAKGSRRLHQQDGTRCAVWSRAEGDLREEGPVKTQPNLEHQFRHKNLLK